MSAGRLTAILAGVAVLAAAVAGIALISRSDPGEDKANELMQIADGFPVPLGTVTAFPDTQTADVATKGWRAQGTIDEACAQWRDLLRTWIDQGSIGSVTGENVAGQRCTLSGPKSGHRADLALTLYGEDTTPSVTLTIRK